MYSGPSPPIRTVAPLRINKTMQHHHRQQDPQPTTGDPTPPPSPPSPKTTQHNYLTTLPSNSPTTTTFNFPLPPTSAPLNSPPPAPTYLRAIHAFHPTAATMAESDCLSFEPDQIIQVHTLHPSGWADGTLLATNERGWFPSNYCEPYTLSALRPLLGASALLYATVRAKRVSQYYEVISCVVTSVRGLLVSCNALSRDTELVRTEPEVRKARKHLLSELGILAALAKKANTLSSSLPTPSTQFSTLPSSEDTDLEIEALGEAISLRTQRLVNRAERLIQIATPFTELWREEGSLGDSAYIPPTPPVSGGYPSDHVPEWDYGKTAARQGSISTGVESLTSSMSDDSLQQQQYLANSNNWALYRLNTTHDLLLSHLAGYIGRLHVSGSPGQIFETTNLCVNAARNFLGVVRAITTRKGVRLSSTGALEQSSNLLWSKCHTLVNVAREVVSSHGVGGDVEEEDVVIEAEVRKLVEAATACVRSAGECVALGHCLLEAMGDFELTSSATKFSRESLISLTPLDENPTSSSASSISSQWQQRRPSLQPKHLSKQLPPPPTLSDDNPKRPLPAPPRSAEAPVRKAPPKLKLVSSHTHLPGRSPITPGSTRSTSSPVRSSHDLTAAEVLKQRDAEAQSKFLAALRQTESHDKLSAQVEDLSIQDLSIPVSAPEIVEPSPTTSRPTSLTRPSSGHLRQISHPQLRRDSLFRSESDEAMRLADTLTMPRIGSSSGSSNASQEHFDVVDERRSLSIPTSPEPGTPLRPAHDANETSKNIILNAEGQVMGATLEGLVERMTLHDAPPDAVLSTTFYLTFRLFTTPKQLAKTLVKRFNVEPADGVNITQWQKDVSTPIKLRVFNVFKGWMESHWRQETDSEALDVIIPFAQGALMKAFAQSGKRLEELAKKVSKATGPLVPRQVSSMGKTAGPTPSFVMSDTPVPPIIISKSLLTSLKSPTLSISLSIMDFDPLELARQFTIKESKIFCAVLPEELVGQEFRSDKRKSSAVNVKALSTLSSVMTAWVADSIMDEQADVKRRAATIKHWIKVCAKCLALNNYSSMYNIFCALESTSVQRLNKTWPLLPQKHKETMDQIRHLTDTTKNHAVYRNELRQRVPPCLPFMGLYLTDLTFVDEGNPNTRPVSDAPEGSPPLINFDKHIKTARIISDVQRFQIPYRLQEVPELQSWIEAQLSRVKRTGSLDSMKLYRRSLAIEPREIQVDRRPSADILSKLATVQEDYSGKI